MKIELILLGITCFVLNGCLGTVMTRTGGQGVGQYPGLGVYISAYAHPKSLIEQSKAGKLPPDSYIYGIPLCIVFIAVDLSLDTVLLPVDLFAWPLGAKKGFMGATYAGSSDESKD